jgi:glycosyltransferase involved in cell wall biosynthesis
MPTVSVIVAALHAHGFLGEALDSVLAQSFSDFEILIAPDEAADYSAFAARDRRIRVLSGVPHPTGPGPARNRAMAAARGEWIALLDADDLWSRDYLSILLPLAEMHHAAGRGVIGAAFGRTQIETMPVAPLWSASQGRRAMVRSIPPKGASNRVSFDWFAGGYASFHGITRRAFAGRPRYWRNVFAEDVLFDLETLALAGGNAPFSEKAVYKLRLRPASTTQTAAFITGIDGEYDAISAMIIQGKTEIPLGFRNASVQVFESWKRMNARYLAAREQNPFLTYQNFVCDQL